MSTEERVATVITQIARRTGTPTPDESLFDSGYLDSFALTDLVTALESEFSLRIPDADLTPRKFQSVSQIVSYLEGRR